MTMHVDVGLTMYSAAAVYQFLGIRRIASHISGWMWYILQWINMYDHGKIMGSQIHHHVDFMIYSHDPICVHWTLCTFSHIRAPSSPRPEIRLMEHWYYTYDDTCVIEPETAVDDIISVTVHGSVSGHRVVFLTLTLSAMRHYSLKYHKWKRNSVMINM